MSTPRPYLLAGSLLLGCAADARSGIHGPDVEADDDGDELGSTEEQRLDLGEAEPFEPCSKIDLLFVIDDSMSMEDEQSALIAAFPGFVGDIEAGLASVASYHIGVVTTDSYAHNEPGCQGLGHLVTRTGGEGASGEVCAPFASGYRYIDETEPDPADKFACAAQVGARGMPGEQQVGAMLEAVDPIHALAKSCNTGFIRPDALLVVVVISDEDDAPKCYPEGCIGGTSGTPQAWFEQLVAIKDGAENNVVMLSVVGGPGSSWNCGAEEAPRVVDFTERFSHGLVGDICHMDLGEYFGEAIEIVDTACVGFSPVG